jgi:hypothetical protein
MDGRPTDNPVADPVVEDYLRRLDLAAGVLPDDRRRELVGEIAEHIAASRAGGQVTNEAQLRTLLDRIGAPADIVAAARDEENPTGVVMAAGPVRGRRPSIVTEIIAVLLLTVGSILPIVGWIAGVVMVWLSRRWRTSEKILATLVFPGGPGLALFVGTFGLRTSTCATRSDSSGEVTSCTHSGGMPWLGVTVFIIWVAAPIVVGIVLLVRARDRAAAEPWS